MAFSNTILLNKLLGKWGFEGNFEYVGLYLSQLGTFDLTTKQNKRWLKGVIKNESIDFEDYAKEETSSTKGKESFENSQLNKYLVQWGFEDQYSYGLSYLEENSDIDLSDKKDRKALRKFLKNNEKFIETQDADESSETPKDGQTFKADEVSAGDQTLEAYIVPAAYQKPEATAETEDQVTTDPALVGQAAVKVFGTSIYSNDLGEFFPEDGKISSRMEKLFARLIEIVQDKPFYVEYGDYTDPDTPIKDPVTSPDGKFVFDGSGSRTFKGGRLTGKGLNVEDPNYQGIASENWGKSDSSLIRLSDAEWGKVEIDGDLVEQVGRPKGYQGDLYGVNNVSTFIDPFNALTDSKTGELTNVRKISNILGVDVPSPANDNALDYSILHMAFGQYTDHNMSFLARTSTGQGLATEVDPNDPFDPLNRNFQGQLDPNRFENPVQTGILGGRGELYIVNDDGELVTVAYFDEENNGGKEAGFYEFNVNSDNSVTAKGELLLTKDAENRNKIVHRNRTEALIQNNQLYGATDLQNYYLKESARYNEEDGDFVVYRDPLGNVYRNEKANGVEIGDIVRGDVQKNGKSITIKNYKISSGVDENGDPIRDQLFIDADRTKPADILKTSKMLSSVAVGTDGLQSLPTYSDTLLNNGVAPERIKKIFAAESKDQYFTGRFGPNPLWLKLTQDENFIDFNDVEGYPIIGDISPRVFAPDRTSGAMRGLDQNDDNIADAFAILKEEMPHLTVRDFDGNVIDLSENLQPKINAEDWGTGLLLSHVVGGDWRANENAGLTTFHTLWAREHSFQVDWINSTINALQNNQEEKLEFNEDYHLDLDSVTTDDVANMARRMVEMTYQKILYEQFAPSLVGDIAKIGDHGWDGYNPLVDPSVAEEFSNGGYRYGHSQIQELLTVGSDLFDLFLAPQYAQSFGFSGIINGMTQVTAAEVNERVSEVVRSNLLANKLDLKSANILRTRETGQANAQDLLKSLSGLDENGDLQVDSEGNLLAGYKPLNLKNGSDVTHGILGPDGVYGTDDDTGLDYGFVGNKALRPFKDWNDFGSRLRGNTLKEKNELLAGFMGIYDDSLAGDTVEARVEAANAKIEEDSSSLGNNGLGNVDVWNFMLAEAPSGDHLLGDLASAIVWEQLDRFQDGDSAYYLNSLDGLGGGVWNHTLSPLEDVIARNSTRSTSGNYIDSGFSEDVFKTTVKFNAKTPEELELEQEKSKLSLTDAITGIYTEEQPFDPDSINNVDYLNGFVPGLGEVRINANIDPGNPYILEPNNAIYERVGAAFANIATLWEETPVNPWRANNLFAHNTSASIDDAEIGQGGFVVI